MNLPLNIDPQQILLHLFNFAILAGGLYLILYKPVVKFMKKREQYYQDMDQKANEALESADKAKEEYEKRLEEADKEIEKKREALSKELEQVKATQIEAANKEAEDIIRRARDITKREHDEMMADMSGELKKMAVEAAQRAFLKASKNPYDSFLDVAERSMPDEREDS